MATQKTTSPSRDNGKLLAISDELADRIDELLELFGIEYNTSNRLIMCECPVHGGDNPTALTFYPDGFSVKGYWKCRTHGCESTFKGTSIGLVRGIISHQKYKWEKPGDKVASFPETLKFIEGFLKQNLNDFEVDKEAMEQRQFISQVNSIATPPNEPKIKISKAKIRGALEIPAHYYLKRGYTPEVLDKYDVGLCIAPHKEMSGRVVVPVYDENNQYMMGCTGRSVHEKCPSCKMYHKPGFLCPDKRFAAVFSKWKHSNGMEGEKLLYNYWFAKEHILKTGKAVVVESPGNVWRLEEAGIHNSVGIFGTTLHPYKKLLLDKAGATTLIVVTDKDEAGINAKEAIEAQYGDWYTLHFPELTYNDLGATPVEEVKKLMEPYL